MLIKFLGRVDAGRVFHAGVFRGTNGIGDFFDVGCQPSIIVRGELKVLPLLRVPHLWLTVRTRAGAWGGAGGGNQGAVLGRWGAGLGAEGKGMSKGKGHGIGQG